MRGNLAGGRAFYPIGRSAFAERRRFYSPESPRRMPQFWAQFLINCEVICAIASFEALAILMAVEVWKKTFVMLSPDLV
jgi:hypothetical protein